jgi:type IX secretion system PorP/SprF family membrane protein
MKTIQLMKTILVSPFIKRVAAILMLFALLNSAKVKAQDIHFSQLFETPLLRNPSLAGLFEGDIRVQGVYRDQWNSFANAYRTGSFNAEYKMPIGQSDNYFTAGLQLMFDKAGSAGLTTTHFLPAINYHKSLNSERSSYLSIGFLGGLVQKRFDLSKITTDHQYGNARFDPNSFSAEDVSNVNHMYLDGSAGISYNTEFGNNSLFYIGGAYHHFNRPKSSFYRNAGNQISPKYVGSIGTRLTIDDISSVTIQADHSSQGYYKETIGGIMYSRNLIETYDGPLYVMHIGSMIRLKDAVVPTVKLEKERLAIAISYDVNVSKLKTASMSRGGIELSISYRSFLDRPNSTKGVLLCPKF